MTSLTASSADFPVVGSVARTVSPTSTESMRLLDPSAISTYNYLLGASQLARYLAEYSPDPDADAAAADPTEVTRAHIEHCTWA